MVQHRLIPICRCQSNEDITRGAGYKCAVRLGATQEAREYLQETQIQHNRGQPFEGHLQSPTRLSRMLEKS